MPCCTAARRRLPAGPPMLASPRGYGVMKSVGLGLLALMLGAPATAQQMSHMAHDDMAAPKTPMIMDGYGGGGFAITTVQSARRRPSSTTACSSPTPSPTRPRPRRWRKRSGSIRIARCACGARPGRPARRSTSARAKMKSAKLAEPRRQGGGARQSARDRPRAGADPRASAALQEWRRRQGRRPQFRPGHGRAREPLSR